MTYTGEFAASDKGVEEKPGINPALIGGAIAVIGLIGAAYLGFTQVKPAWERQQTLTQEIETKTLQSQQAAEIERQQQEAIANREEAERQRQEVASLFADPRTLDTLLLDLNREVQQRQGVELTRFQPSTDPPKVLAESTYGPQVAGKLKTKDYQLELKGTFDQTRLVLLAMERLQPLLVVREFKTQVDQGSQEVVYSQGRLVTRGAPLLTTNMTIEALLANPTTPAASPSPSPQ
ncbi:MAG: hypothetical protein F6K32_01115 [Desertifilum sp. SIO1I2]|nr:hypothetical protein [Desertifilum sp. SIO1I2]